MPTSDAPLEPAPLADRLAQVYLVVGPLYRKVMRAVERESAATGLTVGTRAVLEQLLREGALTVPQLARNQDLSRQFVQRMVNEALAQGWVELAANPAHRRSSLVCLTEAGEDLIAATVRREHELMARVGGELTGGEIDSTLRVLTEMLAALERLEAEARSQM